MRYLMNLTYDGSKFYGYQIQKNKKTVEGEIENALSKILNQKINTVASSRTDKDVHAINQYCHFDIDSKININKLLHSINSLIDDSIHVRKIKKVNDNFHSRFNVLKKEYIYKINMGEYNPIEKEYCLQYNENISKELINTFISKISGLHNFKSFTSDNDRENYERDVKIDYKIQNKILILRFESSGFLRYMIRNIVGLLLDINDSRKSIDDIDKIFESMDRCSCGKCAPGCGLYLNKISFKKD